MIIYSLGTLFILIAFFYEIKLFFGRRNNELKKETDIKENPDIAVFIPARNESKVIEELLCSIETQTHKIPSKNIYIIVESKEDKTVEIAKKHHMNYFVRQHLEGKTKGYALQEMVEDLNKKKKFYDLYFIFDADNILDPHFIEYMLKDYRNGYAVSTGYRALKNKDHYFPVSAGLTFFMINELRNRNSLKHQGNLILSGTGYYIHGKYIKEWGTFPFHSLTEDYESSLYYTLHGISTHYQEKAKFYDEQPTTYKQSVNQRSRWIKGYLTNWLHYRPLMKEKLKKHPNNPGSLTEMTTGIIPALFLVVGLLLYLINALWNIGFHLSLNTLFYLSTLLLVIYLVLVLLTGILLWMVVKETELSYKVILGVLFYHPIFLASYLHCFVVALTKKDLGWARIEHKASMKEMS